MAKPSVLMDKLRLNARLRDMFGGQTSSAPSEAIVETKRAIPKYEARYTPLPHYDAQVKRYLYKINIATEPGSPKLYNKEDRTEGLTTLDTNQHAIVTGETGTGKTLRFLNQVYEGFYEATHLSPQDGRAERKFCGFILDGKTDFTPTSWSLAKKYGRTDDLIFFGPTHLRNAIDPFGDESETVMQRANKMLELTKASKPDAGGGDADFFDKATIKLFSNIFLLHKACRDACPQRVPKMSFRLLNQLCTDKGQYRNLAEMNDHAAKVGKLLMEIYVLAASLKKQAYVLQPELDKIKPRISELLLEFEAESKAHCKAWQEAQNALAEMTKNKAVPANHKEKEERGKAESRLTRDAKEKEKAFLQMGNKTRMAALVKRILPGFHQPEGDIPGTLPTQLLRIGDIAAAYEHGKQEEREEAEVFFFTTGKTIVEDLYKKLADTDREILGEGCYLALKTFCETYTTMLSTITIAGSLVSRTPKKKSGQMRKLLDIYTEMVLKPKNVDPEYDQVSEYFEGEHLAICNEKTAGSVGMVATNMCNSFVHEPFCYMFREDATWSWSQVIDQGKIVVLDMPFATYQASATLTSILLKTDFFRTVLARKLIKVKDQRTGLIRQINQEREILYLADEFQTVVSTGKITGEFSFLDRCRSSQCSCVFATQSLANFYASISEKDGEAILANLVIKVFFRNSDSKTTNYASQLSGDYFRLSININTSAITQYFGQSKEIGATGGSQSTQKGARYEPNFFTTLGVGIAMLRLPSRFGKENILVSKLAVRIIKDVAPQIPLPEILEAVPLGNTLIQDLPEPAKEEVPASAQSPSAAF